MDDEKHRRTEYKRKYSEDNYDRFSLYLPKGDKEKLKEFCAKRHISVNALIMELLNAFTDIGHGRDVDSLLISELIEIYLKHNDETDR
ncbi:MAG: hypothetical protein IKN47_00775 [Lachnospiraceae bacterium]|nr:hypothetical protein [Lachnospiraceae bacterium]